MTRTIAKEIDVSKVYNPQNTFSICKGDTVDFTFTFVNGAEAFDISTAKTARIFAKKIYRDGVKTEDNPLFLRELSLSNPTNITCTFTSEETAGLAGQYLLSVILIGTDGSTITTQSIPFELFDNGYAGVQATTKDFRDEVVAAAQSIAKGDFTVNVGNKTVRVYVDIDSDNVPYWSMEVV